MATLSTAVEIRLRVAEPLHDLDEQPRLVEFAMVFSKSDFSSTSPMSGG